MGTGESGGTTVERTATAKPATGGGGSLTRVPLTRRETSGSCEVRGGGRRAALKRGGY